MSTVEGRWHPLLVALLATMLVTACSLNSPPTPEPIPTSIDVPVPTVKGGGCRGIGLTDAILAGDQGDPRVTWLETPDGRLEIVWPDGYVARFYRFDNPFAIVDPNGIVVFREGDSISGGCTAGPNDDPSSILRIDPVFQ